MIKYLGWLKEHPDLTGAQVYDWLEEKLGFKEVAENTVRNYLNEMRDYYQIPKVTSERTYSASSRTYQWETGSSGFWSNYCQKQTR